MITNLLNGLTQDGSVDTSYGENGTAFLEYQFQNSETIIDIEKDQNNRMLFLYEEQKYSDSLYIFENVGTTKIRRFTEDGLIDRSFGTDGMVEIPVGPFDYYKAFSCQPDNKIVLVGDFPTDSIKAFDRDYCNTKIALLRLLENGKKDDSFGMQGEVFIDLDTILRGNNLAFQKDGKILVTGSILSDTVTAKYGDIFQSGDILLIRLLPNGNNDTLFGKNGFVFTDVEHNSELLYPLDQDAGYGIYSLDNDNILIAGYSRGPSVPFIGTPFDRILVKYFQNGLIDEEFGEKGISHSLRNGNSYPQKDGSVFLVYGGGDPWLGDGGIAYLSKFTKEGIIDSSFAQDGIFETQRISFWYAAFEICNTLQDGSIIAWGVFNEAKEEYDSVVSSKYSFMMMRISPDGTPDPTFGNNGMASWNNGFYNSELHCHLVLKSEQQYIKLLGSTYMFKDSIQRFFITRIINSERSKSNEKIEFKKITVFPNPACDHFTHELPENFNFDNAVMTVYDLYGRVVMQKKGMDNAEAHDISGMENGIYFVELRQNDKIFRNKLLITR